MAKPLLAAAEADADWLASAASLAASALAFCWLMKFLQFKGVPFWSMMMMALLPKKLSEDLSVERY